MNFAHGLDDPNQAYQRITQLEQELNFREEQLNELQDLKQAHEEELRQEMDRMQKIHESKLTEMQQQIQNLNLRNH